MINLSYKSVIEKKLKMYSETNIAKDEGLSDETKKRINKNYNKNQQKRRVDAILNNVKNKDSLKEEVHGIVEENKIKDLCKNCKEELVIAVIILYVQRNRNPRFRIEETGLWKRYGLTWRKYSMIVERILTNERENRKRIKTDKKVDNEQLIRW